MEVLLVQSTVVEDHAADGGTHSDLKVSHSNDSAGDILLSQLQPQTTALNLLSLPQLLRHMS